MRDFTHSPISNNIRKTGLSPYSPAELLPLVCCLLLALPSTPAARLSSASVASRLETEPSEKARGEKRVAASRQHLHHHDNRDRGFPAAALCACQLVFLLLKSHIYTLIFPQSSSRLAFSCSRLYISEFPPSLLNFSSSHLLFASHLFFPAYMNRNLSSHLSLSTSFVLT
ncbi:hypothetical protein M440DRAFT_190735 [Trichoderma longibrachiatum ATCC 18648]|uniref:Uncharacterized protein n=1 Tax=Trichoderma longibrachiatum ATCC 18648 TaxID=983965 RepID=A0A2T4CFI0_TRILO|nr:hypothetical protein M440DRAFT_190735 [Trichoderma longibrachiatum ATCC 18648]